MKNASLQVSQSFIVPPHSYIYIFMLNVCMNPICTSSLCAESEFVVFFVADLEEGGDVEDTEEVDVALYKRVQTR